MKKFLEIVAADLYSKFGNELSDIAVVFPNKRAKLFFDKYLYDAAKKTLWSPNYLTISELVQMSSTLEIADTLQLVGELHEIYKINTKSEENFNDFYFWGELLLHDFDDIDKNLVDAQQLFQNLQNLKKMQSTFDFLDDEQRKALEQFFTNFSLEKQSELKKKFIEIWDVLGNIYHQFNEKLLSQNLSCEGMLYRSVIENKTIDVNQTFKYKTYVFVGFNVLNACEKELFYMLKKNNKAMFYWDYDEYYLKNRNQEAGIFMRENLREFPSELLTENFDLLTKTGKKIKLISSPTENAQARYVNQWVNNLEKADENNAVVLCNESLLLPVLYSLPENVQDANVTMGFPLSQTPIYSAINVLINLQTKGLANDKKSFYKTNILDVLQNQYIQTLSPEINNIKNELQQSNNNQYSIEYFCKNEEIKFIFTPKTNADDFIKYLIEIVEKISQKNTNSTELYNEAIFRTFATLNRLSDLLSSKKMKIDIKIISLLLRRLLFAASVPFVGEPTKGLQIMGILETRNLNFDNILILSANENLLPKSENEASFIPYNLRRAFGLTTSDKRNSVYAYYFYRILQRAKNITISYSAATKGLSRGEMSRFVLQLLVESDFNIEILDIQSQIKLPLISEIKVEKTPEIINFLKAKYSDSQSYLSPRALNMFINCSLKFYFKYIAKLNLPNENTNIDSMILGNVFHKTAEIIYKKINKFETVCINESDLDTFLNDKKLLETVVNEAMQAEAHVDEKNNYSIQQLIIQNVATDYIKKLLEFDKTIVPFTLHGMENIFTEKFNFEISSENIDIYLGGRVDRIDIKDNILRVLDYKTGGSSKTVKSVEELFISSKNRNENALQTFLYSIIIANQKPEYKIMPAILYINKELAKTDDIQIKVAQEKIDDIEQIKSEFLHQLNNVISNLFDMQKPFEQAEDKDVCAFCDFKQICKR